MTKLIMTAASLFLLSAPVLAADTPCKGLDASGCSALAGCVWQAERVAGEKSEKSGKPYVRTMKAHCRKGGMPKQSKPALNS